MPHVVPFATVRSKLGRTQLGTRVLRLGETPGELMLLQSPSAVPLAPLERPLRRSPAAPSRLGWNLAAVFAAPAFAWDAAPEWSGDHFPCFGGIPLTVRLPKQKVPFL